MTNGCCFSGSFARGNCLFNPDYVLGFPYFHREMLRTYGD
ncbi:hypothetical protein ADICYQ_4949 [Cyclobacterium qasimii M12-11B]|uniref:Uncharacterized protein n=1 Tax=Cyclobacterium qasimii M12-11B TaxID=641524 RepID=S7V6Y8_9BACT|nr:hypothetical protein ADICYQ_4949 [Cyclobacterium qasimii M12-11B]